MWRRRNHFPSTDNVQPRIGRMFSLGICPEGGGLAVSSDDYDQFLTVYNLFAMPDILNAQMLLHSRGVSVMIWIFMHLSNRNIRK